VQISGRAASPHRPAPLAARRAAQAVYTTNTIEGMHRQVRKAIKTRGHFPDEQAATKLIYVAIQRSERKWRRVHDWTGALRALKIHFGDRIAN
jgi:putative transposase